MWIVLGAFREVVVVVVVQRGIQSFGVAVLISNHCVYMCLCSHLSSRYAINALSGRVGSPSMQQGEGGGVSFDGFVDNHGSLTSRSPAGSVRIHFAGTVEASCGATRDGDVLPTPVLVTEFRTAAAAAPATLTAAAAAAATAAAAAAAALGPASVEAMGVWQDGSLLPDNVRSAAPTNGSQSAGAWVSFTPCAEGTNTTLSVVVRVAISFLGVDEARHSLETQAGTKVRIVRLATSPPLLCVRAYHGTCT